MGINELDFNSTEVHERNKTVVSIHTGLTPPVCFCKRPNAII